MTQRGQKCDWLLPGRWALLVAFLLPAAGCAAGAWLERPLTEDLPIDAPKNGYPTAVRASIADGAPEPTASPAPNAEPPPQRANPNQPLLTPLAVVPTQLVRPQPNLAQATPPPPSPSERPESSFRPAWLETSDEPTLPGPPIRLAASGWQPPHLTSIPSATTDSSVPTAESQKVAPASHEQSNVVGDRQAKLEQARQELIKALESEIRHRREENTSDEELPRLEQQLRLAYLEAGRMEDAVSAVESLDPQQREAWKNLMFGVGVWLSPDEARRAPLRSAKVLRSLREATSDLAAASKLEVRNLVFCERVDHFGWYSEFPRKEFQPKQQVILYAEIENFAAEHKGGTGYETELQGTYEILDSSGQIVASRQLQLDKEVCRNYRRDYFLAYRIYMPDNIAPGRYRLELTVEDLKAKGKYQGRKLGDGVIEFAIR